VSDIQGNILRPYDYPLASHLFLNIGDGQAGRTWLSQVLPDVTTAVPWTGGKPATTLNLAFTSTGLGRLEAPSQWLGSLPQEFRDGMAARADLLGDTGPSSPQAWEAGYGTGDAHVLVSVHALDAAALDQALDRIQAQTSRAGLNVVVGQHSEKLPGAREHFGFDDGFAQPAVAGGADEPPTNGTPWWFGLVRPLPPGEFLLGHLDADGERSGAPSLPLAANGTFLVYRKLSQDVAGFRQWLAANATRLGRDVEWLAAKLVGRWRDGTPLSLSPDHPDPAISGDVSRINEFSYRDDPTGAKCPAGAHIRRVNPRDALGWQGRRTVRHRIIRRGMPYGPALADSRTPADDGQDRGLLFLCFNASIERQFEFLQQQWCNDGNVFGLGEDRDPLVGATGGAGKGKMTINGDPPTLVVPPPAIVTTRGGEYLFVPGLAGLRALTHGS
jgi:Dyp-type peroxidase family